MKVLFILKYRDNYGEFIDNNDPYNNYYSSGLLNSARYVNNMLNQHGIKSHLVQVIDNNDIDRQVTYYQPTHVIIEAMWVVPEKFAILTRLHPRVNWIIRTHSDIPFLANEGIAMDWLRRYSHYPKVYLAANAPQSLHDIRSVLEHSETDMAQCFHMHEVVYYLPNYYPLDKNPPKRLIADPSVLNIACFGAIRPLKNNLLQAVAAVEFAKKKGKKLRFHINATRSEQGGDNNLKNIRSLFAATENELVEHPWLNQTELLNTLATMDVSMNVSFSETFNIAAADAVSVGTPVVVSPEIFWASSMSKADPTCREDILKVLERVTSKMPGKMINYFNYKNLENYNKESVETWMRELLAIELSR